jgi:PAS domain-containing protein
MINNTNGVSYELDLLTGRLKWSDNLYTTYGYDRSDFTDSLEWWTGHIHPDDAMLLNQALDKLVDPAATSWTVQYRLRRGDNTYTPVDDHATIIRDESGLAVRLTGFINTRDDS